MAILKGRTGKKQEFKSARASIESLNPKDEEFSQTGVAIGMSRLASTSCRSCAGMEQNRAASFSTSRRFSWAVPALPNTSFSSPTSDVKVMGELLLKSGSKEGSRR